MEVDSQLLFDHHLEDVARKASQKVMLLPRQRHLLDADGLLTLYKAQLKPIMEYAPLTWMSSVRCPLNLLDKVQRRAEHLQAATTTPTTMAAATTATPPPAETGGRAGPEQGF